MELIEECIGVSVGATGPVLTSVTKNFLLMGVRTDALRRNDP